MTDPYLALKVVMMPKDANPIPTLHPDAHYLSYLTIFGGVILSYIDQAGAIGARHAVVQAGGEPPLVVTVAFKGPGQRWPPSPPGRRPPSRRGPRPLGR